MVLFSVKIQFSSARANVISYSRRYGMIKQQRTLCATTMTACRGHEKRFVFSLTSFGNKSSDSACPTGARFLYYFVVVRMMVHATPGFGIASASFRGISTILFYAGRFPAQRKRSGLVKRSVIIARAYRVQYA